MMWAVSVSSARYVVREDVSAYLLGGSELLEFCGGRRGEGRREREKATEPEDISYYGDEYMDAVIYVVLYPKFRCACMSKWSDGA